MNDETQLKEHQSRQESKREGATGVEGSNASTVQRPNAPPNGAPQPEFGGNGQYHPSPFDLWPLVDLLARRWRWMVLGGGGLGLLALLAGVSLWHTSYTASVQLIRHDSPNSVDIFGYRQITPQTFANVMRSPELVQRVSALIQPPISQSALSASLRVMPDRSSDMLVIAISVDTPQRAVDLANLYAHEAVRFTQELQAKDAAEVSQYLKEQLPQLDNDILALNEQLQGAPHSGTNSPTARPSTLAEKLHTAKTELIVLSMEYTEIHPLVKEQRSRIAALEKLFSETAGKGERRAEVEKVESRSGGPIPQPSTQPPLSFDPDPEILRGKLQSLETAHLTLATKLHALKSFQEHPPGYYRLFAEATPKDVIPHSRKLKVIFAAIFGGLLGVLGTAGLFLFVEFVDPRLKTAADVQRVTRLPLIAALGDLRRMGAAAQTTWALRAWKALQSRLTVSPNHGLVCGIISASHGEGRATWIRLLGQAASQCGFRVLTIATQPSPADGASAEEDHVAGAEKPFPNPEPPESEPPNSLALTPDVLTTPTKVEQRLIDPSDNSLVHIPLPGWVWNLARRKQWKQALEHWRHIDNVVILVELPPASVPEALLLAENLPNLVWLTASGHANAGETRAHLETLRHARCNLVGAVMNHEPAPPLKKHFGRWVGCGPVLLGASLCAGHAAVLSERANVGALERQNVALLERSNAARSNPSTNSAVVAPAEPNQNNLSFSVQPPAQLAPWQERLTLGAGDLLNFSLFEKPELTRADVVIGPDGRVSYLEAQNILAAGLTIDELRARLDEELGKYRHGSQTIVTPAALHSKKYFILGRVTQKGVFTLERPMTLIEAVAKARGLETGLADGNMVELADLSRSFLVRQGQRTPVDFEKLFRAGDLSQNIALEPEDFLYFPSADVKEVYVLGEVKAPGPLTFTTDVAALGAIATRGGFTDRAWKKKVLVVRGSLNRPEPFVVDAAAVLAARQTDFRLQPKDIIYVSSRPWIRAEELLDLAASAFVQAAVIVATGEHISFTVK